jgi:DNA (cytosine-5)-methyltransferase 1
VIAFYNEIDQQCCSWLSNLMDAGHITPGVICDRSIEDILPKSLLRYDRVHMFAGIGGWDLALNLAGWGNGRVWTGSCPCQPFSAAGKGAGFDDKRHLWPAWFHLIKECRPVAVFGEQVAAAAGHGWLDLVSSDMEGQGYRVGAAVLGAHSVGAPHIRQRLWFVADTNHERHNGQHALLRSEACGRDAGTLHETSGGRETGELGNAERAGPQRHGRPVIKHDKKGREGAQRYGAATGFWDNSDWLPCADGKARPAQSGLEPLAYGIPARMVRLRAYGNAIVPQAAAEFIGAYMDIAP